MVGNFGEAKTPGIPPNDQVFIDFDNVDFGPRARADTTSAMIDRDALRMGRPRRQVQGQQPVRSKCLVDDITGARWAPNLQRSLVVQEEVGRRPSVSIVSTRMRNQLL